MAILEEDTIYYRFDHPTGFIFGVGVEAPSEDDGWFLAPEDVGAPPQKQPYECSTLEAFQALLDSERPAAAQALATIDTLKNQLRACEGHRLVLIAEVRRLGGELEEHQAEVSRLSALVPADLKEA